MKGILPKSEQGSFCSFNGTALYIGNSALQLTSGDHPPISGELKIKARLQDVRNQEFSVSLMALRLFSNRRLSDPLFSDHTHPNDNNNPNQSIDIFTAKSDKKR